MGYWRKWLLVPKKTMGYKGLVCMGYEWFNCIAQLTLGKHYSSPIQLASSSLPASIIIYSKLYKLNMSENMMMMSQSQHWGGQCERMSVTVILWRFTDVLFGLVLIMFISHTWLIFKKLMLPKCTSLSLYLEILFILVLLACGMPIYPSARSLHLRAWYIVFLGFLETLLQYTISSNASKQGSLYSQHAILYWLYLLKIKFILKASPVIIGPTWDENYGLQFDQSLLGPLSWKQQWGKPISIMTALKH